jgi:hypothetical protein
MGVAVTLCGLLCGCVETLAMAGKPRSWIYWQGAVQCGAMRCHVWQLAVGSWQEQERGDRRQETEAYHGVSVMVLLRPFLSLLAWMETSAGSGNIVPGLLDRSRSRCDSGCSAHRPGCGRSTRGGTGVMRWG